jgi:hypothetical protein
MRVTFCINSANIHNIFSLFHILTWSQGESWRELSTSQRLCGSQPGHLSCRLHLDVSGFFCWSWSLRLYFHSSVCFFFFHSLFLLTNLNSYFACYCSWILCIIRRVRPIIILVSAVVFRLCLEEPFLPIISEATSNTVFHRLYRWNDISLCPRLLSLKYECLCKLNSNDNNFFIQLIVVYNNSNFTG